MSGILKLDLDLYLKVRLGNIETSVRIFLPVTDIRETVEHQLKDLRKSEGPLGHGFPTFQVGKGSHYNV